MANAPQPKESRNLILLTLSGVFLVLVCCGGGLLARPTNYRVEGLAMEPGLQDTELLIVSALPYAFQKPQRGDVIVFRYPQNPRKNFIKRLIGLPGETVEVREGKVWINRQPVREAETITAAEYEWGPVTIGVDEYFVLGDNRNQSSDSHSWGMLPAQNIIGKAWVTYWPPDRWGFVK